jgi:hypothetical protein
LIRSENPHIFGYVRRRGEEQVLILNNFSDKAQSLPGNTLRLYGLSYAFEDLVSGKTFSVQEDLTLAPCQFVWLRTHE